MCRLLAADQLARRGAEGAEPLTVSSQLGAPGSAPADRALSFQTNGTLGAKVIIC